MLKRLSLRSRIFLTLAFLLLATLAGGVITMWYAQRMETLLTTVIEKDMAAFQIAQELESTLVMQKGLVTYYFLDRDPDWLVQLEQYQNAFTEALKQARKLANSDAARDILNRIESESIRYLADRDRVIQHYRAGEQEPGARRHREVRGQFAAIFELCEQFKTLHEQSVLQAREESRAEARLVRSSALIAIPVVLLLGVMLAFILLHQVLSPIRRLALETDSAAKAGAVADEVKALSRGVYSLLEDVDQTQTELQLSREHLLQSEKLASVGKLAAGVAHSIRNPLTSVKMRLFSMERTLDLSANQKEDFEVISEEIRHIDSILRNFLEFSRRPKLKMQNVSPSDVVDMAVQLLRHRLESYGVSVELYRQRRLPQIEADPEQLKEVLVNIIVNACEAAGDGGQIRIREEEGVVEPTGRVVVIRVSDNGPGVAEAIREQVFQPFFSTKEEGTGLGLSIAARIVEDHGGWLSLRSREGKGATFIITLPCREDGAWLRS
jgi:signal transduction histidine kinase